MPTQPIPFGVSLESGGSELAGGAPQLMNLVVDEKGAVHRRPGIAAYSGAPSTSIDAGGISGMCVTAEGLVLAVGDGAASKPVYRVQSGGATLLGSIAASGRPTFAETEAMVAMCGKGPLYRVRKSDYDFALIGGGSPNNTSHVVANNNRLLANDLGDFKNQLFFSDQAAGSSLTGNEAWDSGTAGYVSADARPDPLVAVNENSNEVYCFGSTNVQVFVPDEQLVYATTTTREHGCIAPYSVLKVDQEFAWLDHMKRIVVGSGRGVQVISGPIQTQLDEIDTFTDAIGFRMDVGYDDALVWAFPSDGRTFVFSKRSGWSQWSGWDSTVGTWKRFAVNAACLHPGTGSVLVGTSSGIVGEMSTAATSDLGETINASTTTGFIDRATSKLKCTTAMRLTLKRGTTTSSTAPVALVSYRDNFGPFSDPLPVDLGATGDTHVVVEYRSLGVYRSRQWKLQFLGTDDFELVSAEEDFTVQGV